MVEPILARVPEAAGNYHRLVLVVAPPGGGKTKTLREASARLGAPLLNVNLTLSQALLDLSERQRALQVEHLLRDAVRQPPGETIFLDNTELLFAVCLRQDPLRLLQGVSRNKTIVASWSGCVEANQLSYAVPGHPEHRRYPTEGFLAVTPTA